jgi:ATP-dependent helicase/nuclease subunit B
MLAVKNSSNQQYRIKNTVGGFFIPIEVNPGTATLNKLTEKTENFDRKARGIFNGDFFRHFDCQIQSGWSKFYNFALAKENNQYSYYNSSGTLKPDDFEDVLQYTQRKILQFAQEIISGKIDITPYKLGSEAACSRCRYISLCRFDWQINDYKYLDSLGKKAVLKKIKSTND